jgi:hypothetical protein
MNCATGVTSYDLIVRAKLTKKVQAARHHGRCD